MTLQEKILEALGMRALTPREVYARMQGEQVSAVDCALTGLLKSGEIVSEAGRLRNARVIMPQPRSAQEPTVRCRRCKEPKPITDFDFEPGRRVRMKTCNSCIGKVRELARGKKAAAAEVSPARIPDAAPQRIVFSPDLKRRLVEVQRRKAEELQAACERVSALRQELADVEEMVRMASDHGAV